MNKNNAEIKDIEVDGNIIRFINVRKGKEGVPSIVVESGVKKVTRKQSSESVKEGRPNLKIPTVSYRKAYEEAFKLKKREKSFQIETILDNRMSEIYEILDKYNIPIDDQLKIHNEITEILNVMEGRYKECG